MKKFLPVITAVLFVACSTTRTPVMVTRTTTTTTQTIEPADSIVFVRVPLEFDQKDELPKLLGSWDVTTMQRQARLPEENLNSVSINLMNDGKFSATTNCGNVSGTYSVKGNSIKFNNVATNCDAEQIREMVRLMSNTVSMYTVGNNWMTLRDNSSNIIFKAKRK